MEDKNKEIIGYCIFCKQPIYKGEPYYVDENGDYWDEFCRDQMKDNAELFGE